MARTPKKWRFGIFHSLKTNMDAQSDGFENKVVFVCFVAQQRILGAKFPRASKKRRRRWSTLTKLNLGGDCKEKQLYRKQIQAKMTQNNMFSHFFKRLFSTCFYCCSNKSHAGLCCSSTEIVEMCPQKNQAWTTKSTSFDIRLGKHYKWDDLFILFLSKSHERGGPNRYATGLYKKKSHLTDV